MATRSAAWELRSACVWRTLVRRCRLGAWGAKDNGGTNSSRNWVAQASDAEPAGVAMAGERTAVSPGKARPRRIQAEPRSRRMEMPVTRVPQTQEPVIHESKPLYRALGDWTSHG